MVMNNRIIDIYVDVSGSMAGYKIQAVNQHIASLLSEVALYNIDVHIYSFAESVIKEQFSKSPNFVVRKESTVFGELGNYITSLQKAKKSGSIMLIYSDGCLVNVAEEEYLKRLRQQLQATYSRCIGILVSHSMSQDNQDNLGCSICNSGIFGIDEDIGVVVAPILNYYRDTEMFDSQIN